ncbi:MAG: prolyl oligopeptidase family serine peptidase [Planctomycetota bacterium]
MRPMTMLMSGLSLLGMLAASSADGAEPEAATWQDSFARDERQVDGATLRYRLFTPDPLPAGGRLPLVLVLHGAGERGDDNSAQLKHVAVEFHRRQATHPCLVLVPQCPEGKRWVEVDWGDQSGTGTFPAAPSEPMRLALEVVDDLIAAGRVDPDRVYVTGLSMGGYGTWYAAGMPGSRFAAAAPLCGGGDPAWANRYVALPVWAFHGDDDQVVPVGRSREMVEAIRAVGGKPKYTEYPGVGHDCWSRTYVDDRFYDWLFAQQRTGD